VQTRSEQEAQIQLLIDSAVRIQSDGGSLSLELMTELVLAASGSGESSAPTDSAEVAASKRLDIKRVIERYLSPLSTRTLQRLNALEAIWVERNRSIGVATESV